MKWGGQWGYGKFPNHMAHMIGWSFILQLRISLIHLNIFGTAESQDMIRTDRSETDRGMKYQVAGCWGVFSMFVKQ